MSKRICGSLNPDCKYFCFNGTCRDVCPLCRNVITFCPEDVPAGVFDGMLAIMNNFRTLHKENIEIKKLLSKMKQNQK